MDVSHYTNAGCHPADCAPLVIIDVAAKAWEAALTIGGLLFTLAIIVCLFRVLKRATVAPNAHN